MNRFVIIGCGNAGFTAAIKLREINEKYDITLITDEDYPPYCRCLLTYFIENRVSKRFLFEPGIESLKKFNINFIKGKKVESVDVEKQKIKLSGGKGVNFSKLLIATGGEPAKPKFNYRRELPIFTLRKFDDALKIKDSFKRGDTAIVEGGGLVSLKALLALREIGVKIKWIVKSDYILSFLIDKFSGEFIKDIVLEKGGIEIFNNDSITDVTINGDKLIIKTEKGKEFEAAGVIVGKGVKPTPLNFTKEIRFKDGYLTNDFLETSISNIYAAGDCNIVYDIAHNKRWKVPLWPLAGEQGIVAAYNMAFGNIREYFGATAINSFSIYENNIITGGKKKIYENETIDFFEKVSVIKEGKILKKFIYKDDSLKGFVLVNDIKNAGKYLWQIRENRKEA